MDAILKTAITAFIRAMQDYLPPDMAEAIREEVRPLISPDSLAESPDQFCTPLTLRPVLERLLRDEADTKAPKYVYPPQKISPEAIFPQENGKLSHESSFKDLVDEFKDILPNLKHRNIPHLWFEHFESLMMLYASALAAPEDGENGNADVSLYDHAKISAAFAVADALYEEAGEKAPEDERYLLVSGGISGIQSFIFQSSGESRKYRSKLLRGRSFAVSLFSELAAVMLCEEIGLPVTSLVLNVAGRFTLLAPNTPQTAEAVKSVKTQVNDWLIEHTYGETVITISQVTAGKRQFESGRFRQLWDEMERAKEEEKYSRIDLNVHGGVSPRTKNYLKRFSKEVSRPLCPLCGKRPSHPDAEEGEEAQPSCLMCKDYRFLGTHLVKTTRLAVFFDDKDSSLDVSNKLWPNKNKLYIPFFDKYQVAFINDEEAEELIRQNRLIKYWELSNAPSGQIAVKFINGYVPVYEKGDEEEQKLISSLIEKNNKNDKKYKEILDENSDGQPKTFGLIALKAKSEDRNEPGKYVGVEALGVLKADVDDLGMLMACGLGPDRFILERLSTLSRQMNNFFAVFLPHFLETTPEYKDVYTVFAGGDDLFLIGPWNRIISLSVKLRQEFEKYVCGNSKVHFCGGISFHKPHTPVDLMADMAENELEKSKSAKNEEESETDFKSEDKKYAEKSASPADAQKNRLTLFSETVRWDEMEEIALGSASGKKKEEGERLNEIKTEITGWMDDGTINQAMLFRLNDLMEMAAQEERLMQGNITEFEDMACAKWRSLMACAKWRSLLAYTTARNVAKNQKDKDMRQRKAQEVAQKLYKWISIYQSKLKIPVWHILYERR